MKIKKKWEEMHSLKKKGREVDRLYFIVVFLF